MTIKNKRKYIFAAGFAWLASLVLSFGCLFASANTESNAVQHGPSSLEMTESKDGYAMTGTLGRERAGFIISTPVNHRYELSFDMTMLVDSGAELAQGAPQNRAYLITLNEYLDSENPDKGNNTHISSSVNGLQLEIRTNPYENAIYVGMMSHNKRIWEQNSVLTWQDGNAYGVLKGTDNELYNYLRSAFWQEECNGVTADEKINVRFYPSNSNGEKISDGSDTHYTFALTPYVASTGELYQQSLLITADKSNVSDSGDFTKTPNLGFFLINEPTQTKEITVDTSYKNIDNGRVRSVTANVNSIPAIKHGEPVQLEVQLIPHKTDDTLQDVTYTFKSMNENIVSVSATGLVTAVADVGGTSILITTSEGNTLSIPVRIFDDQKPLIVIDENTPFPETANQYEEITLPNFTATDNSGEVEYALNLISPTGKPFDLSQETLTFMPTNGGEYIFEYSATDPSGNKTSVMKTVQVTAGAPLEDWVKYESFYSSAKLIENADGSVDFSGEVGTKTEQIAHQAVAWYNNPILFTKLSDGSYTTVEFSYEINYALGDPIVSGNATERSRYFGMYLVEATSDNSVGAERFDWNTPGIQLIIGKRDTVSDNELIWYELRSGTTQLSRQHSTVIDAGENGTQAAKETAYNNRVGAYSKGALHMPWFEDGDMRKLAAKFSTGETIHVKIEYVDSDSPRCESAIQANIMEDNYFILTLDELSFCIPASYVAGDDNGFTRQAYLGFKQFSDNGTIPFDVHISKITNGTVRKVGFASGATSTHKLGDSFLLDAVSYDNDGKAIDDTFEYVSQNPDIATVDADGNVKIEAVGTATILVTSKSTGKLGVHTINVDIDDFTIDWQEIVMYLGQNLNLRLTVSPNTDVPFTFTSDNPRVVAALSNGRLQAVKLGEATITVSYFGHTQTCHVRVITKEDYDVQGYQPPDASSGCRAVTCSAAAMFFAVTVTGFVLIRRKEK